jgi:ribosomal protein S20
MTARRKLVVASAAGIVVLVGAGLGAAGAIGASRLLSSDEESKAVIDDAAAQLGVEPSALSEALKQALENQIDEAVEDGRLTEEQADRLEERLESSDYPPLFGAGHGFGPGRHGHPGGLGVLEAAASYLGMTEEELREALGDETLGEIAKEKGKTAAGLVDELVATQTKRIDEALDEGRLTDEQADRLKAGLEERMQSLVDGDFRARHGMRHRFWPGSGFPRGPPAFGEPSG